MVDILQRKRRREQPKGSAEAKKEKKKTAPRNDRRDCETLGLAFSSVDSPCSWDWRSLDPSSKLLYCTESFFDTSLCVNDSDRCSQLLSVPQYRLHPNARRYLEKKFLDIWALSCPILEKCLRSHSIQLTLFLCFPSFTARRASGSSLSCSCDGTPEYKLIPPLHD